MRLLLLVAPKEINAWVLFNLLIWLGIYLCLFTLVLFSYFIPAYIAHKRGNEHWLSILALNALLGWTFFGWLASLVWACSGQGGSSLSPRKSKSRSISFPCPRCQAILEFGYAASGSRGKCPHCRTPISVPLVHLSSDMDD